jgi:hypothetical protein
MGIDLDKFQNGEGCGKIYHRFGGRLFVEVDGANFTHGNTCRIESTKSRGSNDVPHFGIGVSL